MDFSKGIFGCLWLIEFWGETDGDLESSKGASMKYHLYILRYMQCQSSFVPFIGFITGDIYTNLRIDSGLMIS